MRQDNRMKSTVIFLFLVAISMTAAWAGDNPTNFRVAPYLAEVTQEETVVAFHLYKPLTAYARVYFPTGGKDFNSTGQSKSHFIKITGLQPGLSYRYEVVCGDNEVRTPPDDTTYRIRTACRPGEYFTFAVYGDPRPGDNLTSQHHEEVIEQVLYQEPVFNLVLGDLVDDGAEGTLWEDFFKVEAPLARRSVLYPVLGDNDYAGGKGKYLDYFPVLEKGYYRFEWGGVQFFALDAWDTRGNQPEGEFDSASAQAKWYEAEMSRAEVQAAPFRVVFLHDPVYISRGRAAENFRATWMPLLEKYRADVVFASWHLYERSQHNGVTYIISGGAGAELLWMDKNPAYPSQVDARQYHFCRVDVNANAMTIRSIATDGTVLDTIMLTPRGQGGEDTRFTEKAAQRLGKEILIHPPDPEAPVIPLYLFSYDCSYCKRLLRNDIPQLAAKYKVSFKVYYFDLARPGTYDLFLNAGAEFGRQNADIPAVFMGNIVMGGKGEIEAGLPQQIREYQADPQQYNRRMIVPFRQAHDTRAMGEAAFNTLTLGIVLGAGLLDGINPCAFTTIIFLISYLSLVGATRRRMLITGGVFTAAVFITYFAIGVVFFNLARHLLQQQGIARVVNLLLFLLVAVLAMVSFRDYIKCLKGKASEMTLQLPGFLKKGIHEKIRNFARHKIAMTGTSFVLGVVIAGMELTCTGQVYIPIVTMISEPQHRVMAVVYLLFYNIAFIIPLTVIFLLVAYGLTSEKLAILFKRHVAAVKLGFTLLFAAMAIMIIYNMRWI